MDYLGGPILARILVPTILRFLLKGGLRKFRNPIGLFLELGVLIYFNFQKAQGWCGGTVDVTSMMNVVSYSTMAYGWAFLLPFIMNIVPGLGLVFKILRKLPVIGYLISSIFWILGYLIVAPSINADMEGSKSNVCKEPFYDRSKDRFLLPMAIIFIYFNRL